MASTALKLILCGCIVLLFGHGFSAMARSTTTEADKSVALLQQHLCRDECSKKVRNMYMHHFYMHYNSEWGTKCTKKKPISFIWRINEDSSSSIKIHLHWFYNWNFPILKFMSALHAHFICIRIPTTTRTFEYWKCYVISWKKVSSPFWLSNQLMFATWIMIL